MSTAAVTIKGDKFKAALQARIYSRMAARMQAATVTHTNTDGRYTPSRWFAGDYGDFANRHAMQTAASMAWDNGVIRITMTYEVIPWTDGW